MLECGTLEGINTGNYSMRRLPLRDGFPSNLNSWAIITRGVKHIIVFLA